MTVSPLVWTICLVALAGVIIRPFRIPEAIWAVSGAVMLVLLGLMPGTAALRAAAKGDDVYLFLIGMMLLSETARREGLFDWLAATAVNHAAGSGARLFTLIFASGIVVTTFLSNDATAVVMTPAVYAAARKSKADPLPLLFACALIANAASFVLPISNPANLVLYGGHMPPLGPWLESFALPSIAAIGATYLMLRWVQRKRIAGACDRDVARDSLTRGGWTALIGIVATALLLLTVSAFDVRLGLPTCLAGIATTIVVCLMARQSPADLIKGISWGILPLVAGLFVLVEALDRSGVTAAIASTLAQAAAAEPSRTAIASGSILAVASNLTNNLPAGLIASNAIGQTHLPRVVVDSLLIGVDLGPNLSITGSLATILWLQAIRREGENVGFWQFLGIGAMTMPPALALALVVRLLVA